MPFFLEPRYLHEGDAFREPHITRMTRKFGSRETFERFKKSHGLVPRANEVGLSWTEELLSARVQSATMRSHRLVLWAAATVRRQVQRQAATTAAATNTPTSSTSSMPASTVEAELRAAKAAEALYAVLNRRHFQEAGALNDVELLLSAVEEMGDAYGLTRADAEAFLLQGQGGGGDSSGGDEGGGSEAAAAAAAAEVASEAGVLAAVERVHDELGVDSIPTLVVDGGRFVLPGVASAEGGELILQALHRVAELTPTGKRFFEGQL